MRVEHHFIGQEALDQSLAYWKKVLRLEAWDVKAKISRANDMPRDTQGRCEWTYTRREALIKLLDPVDWDSTIIYPQDHECTLVHELLHLLLSPLDDYDEGTEKNKHLETIIHSMSLSLVELKRNTP